MAFNQLTDAEAERLACLAEECGEVVQAVGKILRHGWNSHKPDSEVTNRERLESELGDLTREIKNMQDIGDIDKETIRARARFKNGKKGKYLHHQ